MLTAVVLLCLVASCFGGRLPVRPRLDGRIVGGETVNISDYPYQLSLQYYGIHLCGASIISTTWALTAAHCVNGYYVSSLSLRAGSSDVGSGGSLHQADQVIAHPNFNYSTMDYDIALIRVSSAFSLSSNVRIIPLPSEGESVSTGTSAVVTGWGSTKENGPSVSVLQMVAVPVISNSQCNSDYIGVITDRMLCAGYTNGGKDACQRDSGGPLAANGKLIGVVSWGSCARSNVSGVYTRVASLRDWITSNSGV
ncbi:trypsin-1-like isoform X2 [Anabrus simplex]|uniref:trypsin-1-like isoform X1 n=1 Tax=Anabrus simplex TaxID=316456 RepID=UPI0035A30076